MGERTQPADETDPLADPLCVEAAKHAIELALGVGPRKWAEHAARAALAAARPFVSRWRPIETAPKDRTPVFVAVPDKDRSGWIVGEAYFNPEHPDDGGWWWAGTDWGDYHSGPISEMNYHQPAFWQPLPEPPTP